MKTIQQTVLLLLVLITSSQAQNGKMLIIGGSSENITSTESWNYEAFNWAVDQSNNKKVAILHYATTTSSSFENYFINYCGAAAVKSFAVNSTDANNASLVNEIAGYDVFYLRGGDQYYYYTYWKGTLMEDAINNKFNEGGVICGTSAGLAMLSGIMYTAENATAYSNECIKNIDNPAITLRDDFIEAMPGFIFDSHFTERGRMGRLVSFMANWKKNNAEDIVGIGVDEITALAIDADMNATAYGAGTVNIYRLRENSNYSSGTLLGADSLDYIKLIQGKTINLNDFTVGGFINSINPEVTQETTASKIYASGNDYLGYSNVALLEEFLGDGNPSDPIIIFSNSDAGLSADFKDKLVDLGATNVEVYETNIATSDDDSLAAKIESTSKYLFIKNDAYNLITLFLNSGGKAGQALKNAFNNRALTLAFIGDNARFCSPVIIGNYLGPDANATISEGLNLIKTAAIVPRTFEQEGDPTELWHASHSSLPYVMVHESIKNGIWLNALNYVVFEGEGSKAKITIHGTSPAMILTQDNTKADFVTQTYSGSGTPQKKAGFDHMYLSFMNDGEEYILGDYKSSVTGINEKFAKPTIKLFPNPVNNRLFINSDKQMKFISIYDIIGTSVFKANNLGNEAVIDIEGLNLKSGVYMVEIRNINNEMSVQKIIVK